MDEYDVLWPVYGLHIPLDKIMIEDDIGQTINRYSCSLPVYAHLLILFADLDRKNVFLNTVATYRVPEVMLT